MEGEEGADLEDLKARVGPKDVVHHEDAVAVGGAHSHGFLGARREQLRPGERARAELVQVEEAVAELEERRTELVLVAVGVLLDEAVLLERPEEAVHSRLRQAEAL